MEMELADWRHDVSCDGNESYEVRYSRVCLY